MGAVHSLETRIIEHPIVFIAGLYTVGCTSCFLIHLGHRNRSCLHRRSAPREEEEYEVLLSERILSDGTPRTIQANLSRAIDKVEELSIKVGSGAMDHTAELQRSAHARHGGHGFLEARDGFLFSRGAHGFRLYYVRWMPIPHQMTKMQILMVST